MSKLKKSNFKSPKNKYEGKASYTSPNATKKSKHWFTNFLIFLGAFALISFLFDVIVYIGVATTILG